jgi:hypothetical protein
MPIDYQNAKIYKLYSPSENLVYIGSTTQKLSQRKTKHVSDFKSWQNGKMNFVTSFSVLEFEDHRIELIENYPCNSKEELLKREGYYIKELDCINKVISGRTQKEYRQDNKEEIAKKHKEYRERNKEEIVKKKKIYRTENKKEISERKKEKITCECTAIVTKDHLAEHRRTKRHLYFLEHGKFPEIKGKAILCQCECGLTLRKDDLARHKKSKNHLAFIESQKEKEYATIIFA